MYPTRDADRAREKIYRKGGDEMSDEIKQSLVEQLERRKAATPYFLDLVDRYMTLWDVSMQLEQDIRARGVTYTDKSSVGIDMWKNNPSVSELVKVTTQMTKLLTQMNLTVDNVVADDADDDYEL